MPLRRSAHAIKRKIEEAQAEQLQTGLPADRVRNQLPGSTLPPGGPSGSGYPPDPDAVTRIDVRKNSTGSVFSRRRLNLIEGSGATLTVADDSGNEEVDITIAMTGGGSGTVTSVALTAPTELSVAGSPITTAGTLALTWANATANRVLAGPTTGSPATPAFRALIENDIPSLNWSKITSTPTTIAGYSITDAYTIAQVDSGFSTVGHAHATGVAGPGRFYYLDPSATADVNSYKQALIAPSSAAETTISQSNTGTGDTVIATFITYPIVGIGVTSLPAGISTRVFRVATPATNQECRLKVDMYVSVSPYAPGNETLVRSDYSPTFAGTAIRDLTWNFAAATAVAMNATDRVVLRLSTARVAGPTSCTATVYFDGTVNLSYIQTTLPSPVDILTTRGDLLTRDASNMTRLAIGAANRVLRSNGTDPSWAQVDLTTDITGVLPAANGGTGQSSYAVGDLLYASGATALSKLAGVATGNALISGGVTTAPSWGKIDLAAHITGILPSANGGTGVNNAGTLTNASNTTITGGGTLALGGFTLTVPATGTAALLATTNVFTAAQVVDITDAGTTTSPSEFILRHRSSGTPAANFGATFVMESETNTNTLRNLGQFTARWATATDASRKAQFIFFVSDTTARSALTLEASGSGPMVGFLGAAAVARQNITGVTTGTLAQVQAALRNLLTGLASLGLITDSTT